MQATVTATGTKLINIGSIPDQGNDGNNELVAAPSPYPLYRRDAGARVHNYGATGALTATLPVDANVNEHFFLSNVAAQSMKLDPGASGKFILGATTSTVGQKLACSTAGDSVEVICIGAGPLWLCVAPTPSDFSLVS